MRKILLQTTCENNDREKKSREEHKSFMFGHPFGFHMQTGMNKNRGGLSMFQRAVDVERVEMLIRPAPSFYPWRELALWSQLN